MSLLLLVLGAAPSHAQEVEGFVEVRLQGYVGVDAQVPLLAVERFRPTFTAPLSDRVQLSTTIETNFTQGWRSTDAIVDLAAAADLDPSITAALAADPPANSTLGISSASDYLSVDRLYVDVYDSKMDVRIGRQALNWGSGFVVNPSDPFPEVLLTQPWKPRSGVNAIKVAVPLGDLHGLQLIVASDDTLLHPRLAARATLNALGADWSLVGAWREEADEAVVGLDIKGTLGVGYWFEGVLHISEEGEVYEEFATGLDYSFPVLEQLIVTGQYYRQGSGSPGRADSLALLEPRKPFQPAFSGRDYGMFSVSAGLIPEVSASALWMQNFNDGSAFLVPSLSTFPTQTLEISLAAQLPIALNSAGGEFRPSDEALSVVLPGADGEARTVDFDPVVPEATLILWTRLSF